MCEMMSKGLKEALAVLIVAHVTHVERVKSGNCVFNVTLYTGQCYSSYSCLKSQKCTLYKVASCPSKILIYS